MICFDTLEPQTDSCLKGGDNSQTHKGNKLYFYLFIYL